MAQQSNRLRTGRFKAAASISKAAWATAAAACERCMLGAVQVAVGAQRSHFTLVSASDTTAATWREWSSAQAHASVSAALGPGGGAAGSRAAAVAAAAAACSLAPAVLTCSAHAVAQRQQSSSILVTIRRLLPQQHPSVLQVLHQWPPATPGGVSSRTSGSFKGYARPPIAAKPHRLHPKQINSRIKSAFGPLKLLQLVGQHSSDVDLINVSAAYSKLGAWCRQGQAQPQNAEVQSALQLLEPLVQRQRFNFDSRSLATIMHACCYLRSKQTMQLLLPVFLQPRVVAQATTHDVANVLWAAAKFSLVLRDSELQQLLGRLCAQLQGATPQDIANSIWAVAEMGKQVPDQQLQQLLSALCVIMNQATPQAVSSTLWACGRFRFLPIQLLTALEQHPEQLEQLLAGANGQSVANMALACGQLGHKSQLLMDALLRRAEQLQEQHGNAITSVQELCNICWSIVVLDMQQYAHAVLQLAGGCSRRWDVMSTEGMIQLYQVHLWLQDCQLPSGDGKGLAAVLTAQQLAKCRDTQQKVLAATVAVNKVSRCQQHVFDTLQCLPAATWQHPPAMEQATADRAALVDVVAVTAAGVKLAIEVDGPMHFMQPGNMLSGSTQHRNRVLEARGYTVISIPYWEWKSLKSQQQKVKYLQHKLAL